MTEGRSGARPAATARLLHLVLLSTPIVLWGASFFLLRGTAPQRADPTMMRLLGLGIGAGLVAAAALVRGSVPRRTAGESADAWWQAHLPRIVMLWGMGEAVGVLGVVVAMVAGDPVGALPLLAASAGLLLYLAPSRLETP